MIVAWVKAVHIAALLIWASGLIALPLILRRHDVCESQLTYTRLRLITHYGYVRILTPAAVTAIAAGILLMGLRPAALEPWLFAKLVAVGLLVALHAYIGKVVIMMAEREGRPGAPHFLAVEIATLLTIGAILVLVLAKPQAPDLFPDWMLEPMDRQLPVRETPI